MGCFRKSKTGSNEDACLPTENRTNENNSSGSDANNTVEDRSDNAPGEDQSARPPIRCRVSDEAILEVTSKLNDPSPSQTANCKEVHESIEDRIREVRRALKEVKYGIRYGVAMKRRQEKRVKLEASKLEKLHKKIFEIQQDTLLIKKEHKSNIKTNELDALSPIEESRVRLGMKRLWPDIYKKFMHTAAPAKLAEVKDEVTHTYNILTSFQKFIGLKVHKLTKHNAKLAKLGRSEETGNPLKQLTWKQSDGHLGDNEETSSDTNISGHLMFPAPIVLDIEDQVKAFNEASQESFETGRESAESGQFNLWE